MCTVFRRKKMIEIKQLSGGRRGMLINFLSKPKGIKSYFRLEFTRQVLIQKRFIRFNVFEILQ